MERKRGLWEDEDMNDPNTGWFGFTDHRAKRHFDNEGQQKEYYKKHLHDENFGESWDE